MDIQYFVLPLPLLTLIVFIDDVNKSTVSYDKQNLVSANKIFYSIKCSVRVIHSTVQICLKMIYSHGKTNP